MSACLVLLGILAGCTGGDARPEDRWLAEDKLRHFTVSLAATTFGYAGARFALEPRPAFVAAGALALAAGFGKEVADVRAGGPFSMKDLVWDATGVALGLTLAAGID